MRQRVALILVCCAASAAALLTIHRPRGAALAQPGGAGSGPADDSRAPLGQLQAQVKHLESLVPDQAAVMTKVGYHFTNLYVAIERENWPLADFYLGEAQNNIDWAVRVRPMRKDPAGRDVDLGGIAESLKNTQLAGLKQAIAAKQKDRSLQLYDQTMTACYACHKASGKPYLRPQRPTEPEVKIINFDPNATLPE
jgi:hypothetical protein